MGNDSVYVKPRCFDPFPFPVCPDSLKAEIRAAAEELDACRKAEHPRLPLTQMYNVLEKLRTGAALDKEDERIKTQGLVLILRELHDRIDALVLRAYGWADPPTDEQILERLVRLNAERALAEKAGRVQWLRPEYQIPRFGSDAELARLDQERRRSKVEQETIEVMSALARAPAPVTISDLCSSFAQGRKVEKRVALTLQALARLGHLASHDGGRSFALRRGRQTQ